MRLGWRSFLPGIACLSLLAGCDFSSPFGASSTGSTEGIAVPASSSSSGGGGSSTDPTLLGSSPTPGSHDTVVATSSVGRLTLLAGTSQTISITFNSSDGLPVKGLAVSGTNLPGDWSGPTDFVCAVVASGSGCVLNLTYSPTAVETGSLTVTYLYVDDAGRATAPGSSITVEYSATDANHVLATATPTGEITAIPGTGSETLGVNFTTDDGKAATDLRVTTDLGALPAGWSSATPSFTCPIVSTGSGCELTLHYAPAAAGSGTLELNYSYTDGSGAPQTGAVVIPYGTTGGHNNVLATVAPAGQINAIESGPGRSIAVTFNSDDGAPASNLTLRGDTTTLPAGWSGSLAGFACGNVSKGDGCQLLLSYAPKSMTRGTLTLGYGYTDSSGAPETGTLDITYAATTDDNVVGTAAPSGEIEAIVGMSNPSMTVSFATDDGQAATALLATAQALPAGWSLDDPAFACAGVGADQPCQLGLRYTPAAAASGSLSLGYTYRNDAGIQKNGTVLIPYRATTNDTVRAAATPSVLNVATGTSTAVGIVFTTGDGNPASELAVTGDLGALPAGWSSAAPSFSCATISAGTTCALALTYAPGAADSGVLSLEFSYTNDAGIANTGTVAVTYAATIPPQP